MPLAQAQKMSGLGRSRKGAWIEIKRRYYVYRQRQSRSRKGAWIEMTTKTESRRTISVAPARERGLKSRSKFNRSHGLKSLPQGSVD